MYQIAAARRLFEKYGCLSRFGKSDLRAIILILRVDSRPQGNELATLKPTHTGCWSGKKEGIKRCLIGFKWDIHISCWMRGKKDVFFVRGHQKMEKFPPVELFGKVYTPPPFQRLHFQLWHPQSSRATEWRGMEGEIERKS